MAAPAMKATYKMQMDPGLKQKLKHLCDNRFDETKDAFITEMEDTLGESGEECPVLTGTLRDSRSLKVDDKPGVIRATLGYGAAYAYWVHERTELYHKVGKSKFLEDPVNRKREVLVKNIIDRVK